MNKIFITGVDTDIGKTFVSLGICTALKAKGAKVGYFKPFQSGAYIENGELKAPDVVEILKHINIPSDYSYLLKGEVSPYLASLNSNVEIDLERALKDIDEFSSNLDITIIEGAGGLYCPIKKGVLFLDFIKMGNFETIIVTTPTLGKINHTLMTIDCAQRQGIKIKGLIINKMPNKMTQSEENFIEELQSFTDVNILTVVHDMKFNHDEIVRAFQSII